MIYDLVIIGMGPAGISASIYAKRAGLNVLCLDKSMPGGYLNFIDRIDNYPGFYNVTGPELAFSMYKQIKELDINFKNENVVDVILEDDLKKVVTSNKEYLSKYVIIATGRVSKELGLEHENELIGRGLSHCALCDGALYKGKEVAVVGGGESALSETLYLADLCSKVYLIHRGNKFNANEDLVEKVLNKHNVEILYNSEIIGLNVKNEILNSISLNDGRILDISCLFSYIGYVPGTKFANVLNLTDKNGYIEVDCKYQTKIDGIYAVGDIIKKDMYQVVTAVAEGAIASHDIISKMKAK